jgi:hypothetical protein
MSTFEKRPQASPEIVRADEVTYDNSDSGLTAENVKEAIDEVAAAGGGGDVEKVGTPLDNQVAVWASDSAIEGSSNLTFDGTKLIASQIGSSAWNPNAGTIFTTTGNDSDFVFQHNASGSNKGRVYVVGSIGDPGTSPALGVRAGTTVTDNEVMMTLGSNYAWIRARTPGTAELNLSLQPVGGNVGINTTAPTAVLDINSDILRLRTAKTPATAGATGNQGDIAWDSGYIYVCVATNTWKRAELLSW